MVFNLSFDYESLYEYDEIYNTLPPKNHEYILALEFYVTLRKVINFLKYIHGLEAKNNQTEEVLNFIFLYDSFLKITLGS